MYTFIFIMVKAKDSSRTVPISGRIAEEDYVFLMESHWGGQVTASEKLRQVCSFFRRYQEQVRDFPDCLAQLHRLLEPSVGRIKEAEREEGRRSELLARMIEALPEMMATLITANLPEGEKERMPALEKLEKQLHRQMLYLLENFLRLGLTKTSPTYDEHLMKKTFSQIQELIALRPSSS